MRITKDILFLLTQNLLELTCRHTIAYQIDLLYELEGINKFNKIRKLPKYGIFILRDTGVESEFTRPHAITYHFEELLRNENSQYGEMFEFRMRANAKIPAKTYDEALRYINEHKKELVQKSLDNIKEQTKEAAEYLGGSFLLFGESAWLLIDFKKLSQLPKLGKEGFSNYSDLYSQGDKWQVIHQIDFHTMPYEERLALYKEIKKVNDVEGKELIKNAMIKILNQQK